MVARNPSNKLIYFYKLDGWEMYDLEKDPNELNSVYGQPEYAALIKELKDAVEYDNTYIFFYSDHCGPFPRHKRAIYNSGTKVPFIIKPPKGVTINHNPDQLLSFIDLAPTILSIVGIDIPDYIQGKAFLGDQKAEENKLIYFAIIIEIAQSCQKVILCTTIF